MRREQAHPPFSPCQVSRGVFPMGIHIQIHIKYTCWPHNYYSKYGPHSVTADAQSRSHLVLFCLSEYVCMPMPGRYTIAALRLKYTHYYIIYNYTAYDSLMADHGINSRLYHGNLEVCTYVQTCSLHSLVNTRRQFCVKTWGFYCIQQEADEQRSIKDHK